MISNKNSETGTRLVLLGTNGGPRLNKSRSYTSELLDINGQLYLVDCGNGVARQITVAGCNLLDLKSLFITHHHFDHNLDYGHILFLLFSLRIHEARKETEKVNTYGPSPLKKMTRMYSDLYETIRQDSFFLKGPLSEFIDVHEFSNKDVETLMEDENVKVSCVPVIHPPAKAYAYRFDTRDKSITISGDTKPSQKLIQLAKGSDILVHEAYYKPFFEQIGARVPGFEKQIKMLATIHTTAEQAGKIAHEAEVKTLVLTHLAPPDSTKITDEMWKENAGKYFKGEIIVGKDLLSI